MKDANPAQTQTIEELPTAHPPIQPSTHPTNLLIRLIAPAEAVHVTPPVQGVGGGGARPPPPVAFGLLGVRG